MPSDPGAPDRGELLDGLLPRPREVHPEPGGGWIHVADVHVEADDPALTEPLTALLGSAEPTDGPDVVQVPVLRVVVGLEPGPAWDLLSDLDPAALPAEGYALRVTSTHDGPCAAVGAGDARGARYGIQTLAALLTPAQPPTTPQRPSTPQPSSAPHPPTTPQSSSAEIGLSAAFPGSRATASHISTGGAPGGELEGQVGQGQVGQGPVGGWGVPLVSVRDWPELAWRGTVEGFYGPPWTHADRLDHLRFAGRHRLNTYVYAPKDDPYHRERWREPYPDVELERLADLVEAAAAAQVQFVFTIAPGLSMRYADDADHAALAAKARQLRRLGVRDFGLLFDDIATELEHPGDVRAFGSEPGAAGTAHGIACARFAAAVLEPGDRLVMVPTDYAGSESSPYRERLAEALPDDVLVWWTGEDIVVGEVTRADVDAAAASYRRDLLLWDNIPVNDFDRSRLFLGPLVGRTDDVAGSALRGISINPMVEAAPSHLALATAAVWAWDPATYDPDDAAARALHDVAGPLAGAIAPLVDACSSWPPGAPQSPRLTGLATVAVGPDGDLRRAAREELTTALRSLAGVPAAVRDALEQVDEDDAAPGPSPRRLAEQLGPWAEAGAAMASAGLAALDLLTTDPADGASPLRDRTRAALARAEQHYPNVLRGVVGPFVREVLETTAPARERDGHRSGQDRPVALVVTAADPAPGDGSLDELLASHGLAVRRTAGADPAEVLGGRTPGVVVVARSASPDHAVRAAALPAPVLTWANLVQLDVASGSGVLTVQDTVHLEEPSSVPEAGACQVYRGPGTVTWGDVGPDAVVLARSVEGRPVLAHYPPGARLVSGAVTEHGRTMLFLGREGMSPWLLTDAGRALVAATVETALAAEPAPAPTPTRTH